jgi:hypothetical protein
LKGCPEKIEGDFFCGCNNLTDLEGCPKIIEGVFYCSDNKLTSLIGSPEIVEGDFYCRSNSKLTDKDFEWLKQNCKIGGNLYK